MDPLRAALEANIRFFERLGEVCYGHARHLEGLLDKPPDARTAAPKPTLPDDILG
jgi:hypothetical protein